MSDSGDTEPTLEGKQIRGKKAIPDTCYWHY